MRLLKTVPLLLTLLFSYGTNARKWSTDKDSIIVDASYVEEDEGDLDFDALMDQAERPECMTADHEQGSCVTLRKCHPILFGDRGELRNPSLAESYSENVDACGTPSHNGVEDEPVEGDESVDEDFVRSAVPIANKAPIADKIICCPKDKIQYAQRSLDNNEDESMYQTTTGLPVDAVPFGGNVEQAVTNFEELVEEDTVLPLGASGPVEVLGEVVESTGKPDNIHFQNENVEVPTVVPIILHPEQPSSVPPVSSSEPVETIAETSPSSPEIQSSTSASVEEVSQSQSQNEVGEEASAQESNGQVDTCPAVTAYNTWPSFKNYPFLAAIQVRANTGPLCSGSLIDSRHILTAAHCLHRFNSKDVARMQVRIGFTKNPENDTFNDFYMERKASKIIFHKRFHEQSKMDNNIALVQLNEPVTEFDDHIAPINVFDGFSGFDTGSCAGVEAGWIKYGNRKVTGISDGVIHYVEPPKSEFVLREAINKIFANSDCHRQLYTEITGDMLCAKTDVFEAKGVTAGHFRGNDGGPLVIRVGDRVQQVGIKSWAYEGNQYPTVYLRVSKYLQWIRDNLEM